MSLSCVVFSYGFVEFEDTRDADDAVYELNGKELCGERVMVEHARGPRRDRDGYGGGGGGGGGGGYYGGGRSKYSPRCEQTQPRKTQVMYIE